MRPEDRLLFHCCRQDFSRPELMQLLSLADRALDWMEVYELSYGHGVAPLVFRNLEMAVKHGLEIPDPVLSKFKLATYHNIAAKSRQATKLANVLASLQEEYVDLMVVKGAALDLLVYDQAWYTVSADIDAVVRPRTPDLTKQELDRISSKLVGLEYEFYEHHDLNLNRTIPLDFDRIWRDASVVEYIGRNLYLMSPEDMLLAVCNNSCRKRYFRLRSLADLSEIVRRMPNINWSIFTEKALTYRSNEIAYTALSVVQATMGSALPANLLEDLRVGQPKRWLIDGAIRLLVSRMSLRSLSYYTGPELIGRKVGWSLLLPYLTYRNRERRGKIREAFSAYTGTSS